MIASCSRRIGWRRGSTAAAALLLCTSLGCGEAETTADAPAAAAAGAEKAAPTAAVPAKADASANATAEAKEIFATRCVVCHGPSGAGNGPGSKGLSPQPRNFQDPGWQAEVTDEHLANIIQYGGAAVGRSPTMPGNPDLSGKPEVVKALVAYVRNLSAR